MRRGYVHGTSALADPPGRESSDGAIREMRTEFPFVLPRGYVDSSGSVHRQRRVGVAAR
jgi:hypothetical protein